MRSHVAKKVSHKPHLFCGANDIGEHKLQSSTALLRAPSKINDENCYLLLLVFLML